MIRIVQHFLRPRNVLAALGLILSCMTHAETSATTEYQELEWIALMPADDLDALMNPPEFLADLADGSQQDSLDAFAEQELADDQARRFQQALQSTNVVPSFDNKPIRIPGFIVPLESKDDRTVTEFFIVPYFGACLHMPPPPPNQIIYTSDKAGIELESLQEPFWFAGTLKINLVENAIGTSAYTLVLDKVEPYEY